MAFSASETFPSKRLPSRSSEFCKEGIDTDAPKAGEGFKAISQES